MPEVEGVAIEAPVTDEPQTPPETAPAEIVAPEVEAEAQSDVPADEAPVATPTEPATPAVTTERPWSPRADGTDLQIPGAVLLADGSVKIPPETVGQMHRFLANREAVREREVANRREIERLRVQADPQHNAAVIKANTLMTTLLREYDRGENPETGRRYIEEYFDRFHQVLPVLEANAERDAAKAERDALKGRLEPIDQETQWRQAEPVFMQSLANTIDAVLAQPDYEGVDPRGIDRASLEASLKDLGRDLFRNATHEDAERWDGIKPGQWIIDPKLFAREVKREAGVAKRLQEAQARAAKTAAVQQQLKPAAPPPAVSTKGSPTPQTQTTYDPKTADEWDADWMKNSLL